MHVISDFFGISGASPVPIKGISTRLFEAICYEVGAFANVFFPLVGLLRWIKGPCGE